MVLSGVSREEFPASERTAEGMQVWKPVCDHYETVYEPDAEYVVRDGRSLFLQIIRPLNPEKELPLVVFIPGSAFHEQNVKGRVAQLGLLAAKGCVVALLEYRGSETAPFPGFVLDAKAGIHFMRSTRSSMELTGSGCM